MGFAREWVSPNIGFGCGRAVCWRDGEDAGEDVGRNLWVWVKTWGGVWVTTQLALRNQAV
jgi:hypothetical protein